jgi:hypothetical protein
VSPESRLSTEALTFAALALAGGTPSHQARAVNLIWSLQARQRSNGGWAPIPEANSSAPFATAIATITLVQVGADPDRIKRAAASLLQEDCREASWIWRWKLRVADDRVKFNPCKFGWGWVPDTVSWVIPTAFAIVALSQIPASVGSRNRSVRRRIDLGRAMLLDRACEGGGWNAGNSSVYGVPLRPQPDATAAALLALPQMRGDKKVIEALNYLSLTPPACRSPYTLAWAALALLLFRDFIPEAGRAAETAVRRLNALPDIPSDVCTLAACCLATDALGGRHVFRTSA